MREKTCLNIRNNPFMYMITDSSLQKYNYFIISISEMLQKAWMLDLTFKILVNTVKSITSLVMIIASIPLLIKISFCNWDLLHRVVWASIEKNDAFNNPKDMIFIFGIHILPGI